MHPNLSRRKVLAILFAISMVLALPIVFAKPDGRSGISETGCGDCHGNNPTTAVNVSITGAPLAYTPGQSYSLQVTVTASTPSGSKGGFDLRVSFTSNGNRAGTLTTSDSNAKIMNGDATHSNDNARTWSMNWQAPTSGGGQVKLTCAGNAVNGDGQEDNLDKWNTVTYYSAEATPPTVTLSDPSGGQDWTGGETHRIWWNMSDAGDANTDLDVYLNYSYNSGSNTGSIAGPVSGTANPNYYDWNVPAIDASDMSISIDVIDPVLVTDTDVTTVPIVDSTAPTISSISPADTTVNIPTTSPLLLTMDEGMNPATPASHMGLRTASGQIWVAGSYSWNSPSDTVLSFTPSSALSPDTEYEVVINSSLSDDSNSGNTLASPSSTSFTTRGAGTSLFGSSVAGWGFTIPSVASPGPAFFVMEGVPLTLFLEAIDLGTHDFYVDYDNGGTPGSGENQSSTFSNASGILNHTFTPTTAGNFTYYSSLDSGVMYGDFNVISNNTPPLIVLSTPNNAQDWSGGSDQRIWWNTSDVEDANTDLVVYLNYSYNSGAQMGSIAGPITGTTNPMFPDWTVPSIDASDVQITATVIDTRGFAVADIALVPVVDSAAPTLDLVDPADLSSDVPRFDPITVTFNEAMNTSRTESDFGLFEDGGSWISGTFGWNSPTNTILTFYPDQPLLTLTIYYVVVNTTAADDSLPGNDLGLAHNSSFITRPSVFNLYGDATLGWGLTAGTITSPGPAFQERQGDNVSLVLYAADGSTHDFFIDYDGNGSPDPGENQSADFTNAASLLHGVFFE